LFTYLMSLRRPWPQGVKIGKNLVDKLLQKAEDRVKAYEAMVAKDPAPSHLWCPPGPLFNLPTLATHSPFQGFLHRYYPPGTLNYLVDPQNRPKYLRMVFGDAPSE
jgi:hypothetical protein